MSDFQKIVKKSIGVLLVLVFMNSLLLIFSPAIYTDLRTLIPVALLSAVTCIDVAIRPISPQRDRYNRSIVAVAFLLFPVMVSLPYYEWHYLISLYQPNLLSIMAPLGTLVLLIGGVILLSSRIQIGQYGGGKITIEEDHQLLTTGMYKHIRNPQYLGFLLLFAGYSIALGSLLVMFITVTALFLVFRSRMILEEVLLNETFGEKYAEYSRRTRRLLPWIY